MSAQVEKRTLIALCGLLVTVLASRVFYLQELFFALLLFAGAFVALLLLACFIAGVWMFYEKAVISLARWTMKEGHRGLLALRAKLLELAPTISRIVSAARRTRFYPLGSSLRGWVRSLQLDALHFRADAERAVKHLRLLLKQS